MDGPDALMLWELMKILDKNGDVGKVDPKPRKRGHWGQRKNSRPCSTGPEGVVIQLSILVRAGHHSSESTG